MTDKFKREVTMSLVVGSRQFFNGALACLKARNDLEAQARRLGIRTLMPPVDATVNGAVQSRDDAKHGRFFAAHKEEIDGLDTSAPPSARSPSSKSIMAASLGVPILLQACNDGSDRSTSRAAATPSAARSRWPTISTTTASFTETTSHTSDLDGEVRRRSRLLPADVCRTVRGLRHARIGAIGARTAPFEPCASWRSCCRRWASQWLPVDLSEIIGRAKALDDGAASIKDKLAAAIGGYGKIDAHIRRNRS